MTGGGDWDDMAMSQWPADGELPPPVVSAFDALLDRAPLPDGATAELEQLAAAFGELYAAPVDSAAAAEQYARAAFRVVAGLPQQAGPDQLRPAQLRPAQLRPAQSRPARHRPAQSRPARHRPARRQAWRSRFSARIAAIGAAVVVTLGGAAAAAAYTGALPGMVHRLTPPHHPAAPTATTPGSPAQPTTESRSAAPGTAGGLCTAYRSAVAHGSPGAQRKALRRLAAAAGGAGNVASYCAGVGEPQPAPGGQHSHSSHPAHPAHPAHPPHPTHPPHPAHPSNGNGNSNGPGNGNG